MDKTAQEKEPKKHFLLEPSSTTNSAGPANAGLVRISGIFSHSSTWVLASSPQAPPYMWGVQPPYGTPPHPYVAMYPHGGIYAHPSIPPSFAMPSPNGIVEASGNTPGNMEADGKPSDVKEKLPIKRFKREFRHAESGSEGTSEGSEENSHNDSHLKSGGRQDSGEGEASQNGNSAHGPQNGGANTMVSTALPIVPISTAVATTAVPGPTTNLHIGMDYWGSPASSTIPAMRGKVPPTHVQSQIWLGSLSLNNIDERELKRQRRKQSNRESARRSRLRKQAECDELAQRAEVLKEENASLRSEANRIKSEYEQLLAENTSLKRLKEIPGHEDLNSSRNDQHTNNDKQIEQVQGSQ
ncbi:hypothetical protein ES319_1Z063000v1 [Gossypium barbadense]|uniref:BZIP domain-containing protein n=1 Tax=Gossypium barbadense TaxID=3634 RepID=A0A5J5N8N9_GOSBA|nr:hypothetical protein ES319_1Z063000v1 [Gossypium barbadense]